MKTRPRPARQSGCAVPHPGGTADYEEEEFDEIESLPREIEHDEEERDPDPERYAALTEHAQEQRRGRPQRARRKRSFPVSGPPR